MSALLSANQWEKVFPQTVVSNAHPDHATLQSFVVAVYVRPYRQRNRALLNFSRRKSDASLGLCQIFGSVTGLAAGKLSC